MHLIIANMKGLPCIGVDPRVYPVDLKSWREQCHISHSSKSMLHTKRKPHEKYTACYAAVLIHFNRYTVIPIRIATFNLETYVCIPEQNIWLQALLLHIRYLINCRSLTGATYAGP